jgi:hypothetical protein
MIQLSICVFRASCGDGQRRQFTSLRYKPALFYFICIDRRHTRSEHVVHLSLAKHAVAGVADTAAQEGPLAEAVVFTWPAPASASVAGSSSGRYFRFNLKELLAASASASCRGLVIRAAALHCSFVHSHREALHWKYHATIRAMGELWLDMSMAVRNVQQKKG